MLRAVIFDLDDTLYPENDYVKSGFRAVADRISRVAGVPVEIIEAQLWHLRKTEPRNVFDVIVQLYPCIGMTATDLVRIYRCHQPAIVLDKDARDVLSFLRTKYLLGVISDGYSSVQQRKVEALGLDDLVDVICLTDAWGREYWKPHERAFLHVASTLGVPASACCYVGDNLSKDFIAPNRLGMVSVHLARPGGVYADVEAPNDGVPSITIRSLSDLPGVLSSLSKGHPVSQRSTNP